MRLGTACVAAASARGLDRFYVLFVIIFVSFFVILVLGLKVSIWTLLARGVGAGPSLGHPYLSWG